MLNKILISFAILLLFFSANADELKLNPEHPGEYMVVKGDTLWDISARFLKQPWRWQEIWGVNPQIKNPHLIYPGDVVSLSFKDGKPVLNLERAGQVTAGRNVKLSPTIRSSENIQAIPAIPIDAIQQFLVWPIIYEEDEMDNWPYVVSSYDGHLIASANNIIYIRGLPEDSDIKEYSIYRKGPAYKNVKKDKDEEDEVLGYEGIYIGQAVMQRKGDPASAVITSVDREVLVGDRLVPNIDEDMSTEFLPSSTKTKVEGSILSVLTGISQLGGVAQIGQYQVVVLNVGANNGIEPGNVFGIFQNNFKVKDSIGINKPEALEKTDAKRIKFEQEDDNLFDRELSKLVNTIRGTIIKFDKKFPTFANRKVRSETIALPEEHVGVMMVFRTFKKISYALVMETNGPVHIFDTVRSL
jgi:hypothetical protein